MPRKAARDNRNAPEISGPNKRRALDVYYTQNGTKLFVENGVLIEETPEFSLDCLPVKPTEAEYEAFLAEKEAVMSELFTSDPVIPPPPASYKAIHLEQTRRCAEAALEFYNKKHNTQFVPVDLINSCGCLWEGEGVFSDEMIWHHCNFTAKVKPETSSDDGDSSTKLFFAETNTSELKSGKTHLVTVCCILDGTKTTLKCEMCLDGYMQHPTRGFIQGRHKVGRDLRPRHYGKVSTMSM